MSGWYDFLPDSLLKRTDKTMVKISKNTSCSITQEALKELNMFCLVENKKNHSYAIHDLIEFYNQKHKVKK